MVIAYDDNWRKIHWKSLESAYRSSPYFEYYEDDFYPFYHGEKPEYLADFNSSLNKKIIELLDLEITITETSEYTEELGRMTALSYPVIVIPSMLMLITALWYIFSQIKKLTGEDLEKFLADV